MSKYRYIIKESLVNTANVLILNLIPKNGGTVFGFRPGQYAMLSFYGVSGKLFINHPFSIASAPTQTDFLQFGIKIAGEFTQTLSKLAPGHEIEITGPFGNFVFDENEHADAVFIAGGIGITPFISAIRYATDKKLANRITLLYSNRTLAATSFYNEIEELSRKNQNFRPVLVFTQEVVVGNEVYFENSYLTKEIIMKHIGQVTDKNFFICGPIAFMKAMENNLLALGVSKSKIHQEAFSMSPQLSFKESFKNILAVTIVAILIFTFFLNYISPKKNRTSSTIIDRQGVIDSIDSAISSLQKSNDTIITPTTTINKTAPTKTNPQVTKQPTTTKSVPASQSASANTTAPAPTPAPRATPVYVPAPAPTPVQAPAPTPTTKVS